MFQLEMARRHFNDNGVTDLQSIIFGVAGGSRRADRAVIVLGQFLEHWLRVVLP